MYDCFKGFFIDDDHSATIIKHMYRIGKVLDAPVCITTESYEDSDYIKVYAEVEGFIPREYVMSFTCDDRRAETVDGIRVTEFLDDILCDKDNIYHDNFRDGVLDVINKFVRNYMFSEEV